MWKLSRKGIKGLRDKGIKKDKNSSSLHPFMPSSLPKGFSLLEALIATAIVGIGFVGIYSLVALSEQYTRWAIARQKLQMTANQMLDVIESDVANISNYNITLTTCTDPGAVTTISLLRGYEWCVRMRDELGAAGATDTRSITITNLGGGNTSALIHLEAYGTKAQVIMGRTY